MTGRSNRGIIHAIGLVTLLIAPTLAPSGNALADIALGDVEGQTIYLSGWMRTREYVWSYFNPGTVKNGQSDNQYNYQANVIRLGLGYQLDGVKFFIEGMNPAFFNLPSSALPTPAKFSAALGTGANYYFLSRSSFNSSIFLKQGDVEFGQQLLEGLDIKGGRFEFLDGSELMPKDPELAWLSSNQIQQRLLGNFGWSDVMRSFDGAKAIYGSDEWNATVMYGVPTKGVFDLDGMDEVSGVDVIYAALNAGPNRFWGNSLGRIFYIWYDDNRGLIPTDNEAMAAAAKNRRSIRIDTIGADAVHAEEVGPGTADTMVWGAFQFGNWGNQAQRAYAAVAQAGYRLTTIPWKPWLRGLFSFSSGDSNSNNGVHGTFFDLLSTPRPYALNPIYNDLMNIIDVGSELMLDPIESVETRTTLHGLWLSSSRDQWYAGGGAFDNNLFGYAGKSSFHKSYLGTVVDSGVTWKVSKHLTIYLYGGHMFGGSVVGANYPSGREETFGYAESTISF